MKKIIILVFVLILLMGCTKDYHVICITKDVEKSHEMKIHYIDIENGRCAFVELPNGENLLLDTGGTQDFHIIYEYLRKLKIKIIDYMFISANDQYHLGGAIKVLNNFEVHEMFVSKSIPYKALYKNTAEEAIRTSCRINTADGDTVIFHNDDLTLSVVTPVNDNYENYEDFSLSLMITYGDVNFLMIGCFGEISENDLLKTFGSFIKSDLLSLTSSEERNVPTTAFLQKVSSCYSVIQVFDKKLPKKSMINTMEILGSYVLRTDVNGNIKVTCNSKEITGIRTER